MPTKYTSGAEKLLLKYLLGIEVPTGKFASDVGVLCQNVGTVVAMFDAVVENRPLISRAVTVAGSAVKESKNLQVRLGASYDYLLSFVDMDEKSTPAKAKECIRCGLCNTVCPVDLLPQQLYWYSKSRNIEKAVEYNLLDCIECNCCSYVCPSQIPLVNYYQYSKALYKQQVKEKQQTENARERFEFRELRLERNKRERAEMMEVKKIALKEKIHSQKKHLTF